MIVVATAGHVDHGKTTLVAALTGIDADRWPEEKARGVTIDIGFAHLRIGDVELSFVDLPGHTRFVRNMLAGVSGAQACLFVVSAVEGWREQSEEHLRVLEALAITDVVAAVTKADLVSDDELADVSGDVEERLRRSTLTAHEVLAVDAISGRGLDDLQTALQTLARGVAPRADRGRPRLWIDRSFTIAGAGTVVTGTLTDGTLRPGHEVVARPGVAVAKVRGLQNHGVITRVAMPGERVAVNLTGLSRRDLDRGAALVRAGQWHMSTRIDAELVVADGLGHAVNSRGAYLMSIGTGERSVSVRLIGADSLEPGATGPIRVQLRVALPLVPGDRYVLREAGRREVIGGGTVLDVDPVLPLERARPDLQPERVIAERGWLQVDDLARLTGHRLPATVGNWVAAPAALDETRDGLLARITAAGVVGVDLAELTERDRALVNAGCIPGIDVRFGNVRSAQVIETIEDHPWVEALRAAPFDPPPPFDIDPAQLRLLQRNGTVVTLDGLYFHASALEAAAAVVVALLAEYHDGVTVAQVRDALSSTRKHVLPLLNRLDHRGITARHGDLRVVGPRAATTS